MAESSWWDSTFGQAQDALSGQPGGIDPNTGMMIPRSPGLLAGAAAGAAAVASDVQETAAAISLRRSLVIAMALFALGLVTYKLKFTTVGVSLIVAGVTLLISSIAQYG